MNRKHNPLVALVALVALLLLAVPLLCEGCSGVAAAEEPEEPESSPRFTIEAHRGNIVDLDWFYIITDTETGVQYLFADGYYSGGMTVLQPAPEEATP